MVEMATKKEIIKMRGTTRRKHLRMEALIILTAMEEEVPTLNNTMDIIQKEIKVLTKMIITMRRMLPMKMSRVKLRVKCTEIWGDMMEE